MMRRRAHSSSGCAATCACTKTAGAAMAWEPALDNKQSGKSVVMEGRYDEETNTTLSLAFGGKEVSMDDFY